VSDLLARALVPVATTEDAETTAAALAARADDVGAVAAVHVVPGADDPGPERRDLATDVLGAFVAGLAGTGVDTDTRVLAGPDVVETVVEAAHEADATAIAFTPRSDASPLGRSPGDTAARLVRRSDLPVVAVPAPED
jgi:nucleotide-binding universal stress UspA family protein